MTSPPQRKSDLDSNRLSMREEIGHGGFERQFNQDWFQKPTAR